MGGSKGVARGGGGGARAPPPKSGGSQKYIRGDPYVLLDDWRAQGEEEEGRKSGVGRSLLVVLVWMAARERWC